MANQIDYRYNAEERVRLALSLPQSEHEVPALVIAQIATAEAVLALVEQQRIANLIALSADAGPRTRELLRREAHIALGVDTLDKGAI